MEKAMFAAGCFWGVEAAFREVTGVTDAISGYSDGNTKNPTYREVCNDNTGHAEVVLVSFDSKLVTFQQLVEYFFTLHDPTQLNRQGPDVGSQYRSGIYYFTEQQREIALKYKESLGKSGKFSKPIVTEIKQATEFYAAEDYHQRYFEKHPEAACHIIPTHKG